MYENNPLLSIPYQRSPHISIYSPAVSSSGDIYHIAGYCLICEEFNWYVPKIFLCYDNAVNQMHANRAQEFLRVIFEDRIRCLVIYAPTPPRATRYSIRNKIALRTVLSNPAVNPTEELVLNQKLVTSLIQGAMLKFGHVKINAILRYGFKNRPILKLQAKPIATWIKKQAIKIRSLFQNQPFVVIHNRYSTQANDGQNLSNQSIQQIARFLEKQRIRVILVNVSSEHCPAISGVECINAFERIPMLNSIYSKSQHILLLSAISDLPGFQGVIGGTSGTLDVIAFMGIKVLNLHNYSEKKRVTFAPHQDFRILLQCMFMSICHTTINEDIIIFWLAIKNFLYYHGSIPMGLSDIHDDKVERQVYRVAYQPSGALRPINCYYPVQKRLLEKQSELMHCFNQRKTIKQEEGTAFSRILERYQRTTL